MLIPGATPAETFGVVREENLENHLPPVEGAPSKVVAPSVKVPPDAGAEETPDAGAETDLGVARNVPVDPRLGPDTALGVAYQIVTGAFTRASANAASTASAAPAPAPAKKP